MSARHLPKCFCPRILFGNDGLNRLLWNSLVSCLHSQLGIFQGYFRLCNWLSLRCLGHGLNTCPLYISLFLVCNYILYKLLCKFDRIEKGFSLLCKYMLLVTIDRYEKLYVYIYIEMFHSIFIYCHLSISVSFILIFTSQIAFNLTEVLFTSISRQRDPYSFYWHEKSEIELWLHIRCMKWNSKSWFVVTENAEAGEQTGSFQHPRSITK